MINEELINPESIVVVGGSGDLRKPGGRVLRNILDGHYKGKLYAVNPKQDTVQGVVSYRDINEIPETALAIIAISYNFCLPVVETLVKEKRTKAFIIVSAGFSEAGEEGRALEKQIAEVVTKAGGTLIGPNCIGVITQGYTGVFTTPVPMLSKNGCDFVSGSGATAVFIFESAISAGLNFSSIFSVGNSAQTGVEDILEYWDETFDPLASSKIKLIYVESIRDPARILLHASSLIRKGCRIAAIKAGTGEAGMRAASSHTGAMATSDTAVEALFRKAGIVRCSGREELTTIASVFFHKPLKGKNIAVITHAGGPAVMLTDVLTAGGMSVPVITGEDHDNLLNMLNPGASAINPVDMIATATAEQLEKVIGYADKNLSVIDGMAVIFGSNGMNDISEIYTVLDRKIKECTKPIFPVLPSVSSSSTELRNFLDKGNVNFSDEVVFGRALTKIFNTPDPATTEIFTDNMNMNVYLIRKIIDNAQDGYLNPSDIKELLNAAGIPTAKEYIVTGEKELQTAAEVCDFPLAMKVIGPVHKSDIGGVTLNIGSIQKLEAEFARMIKLPGVTGVLTQQMLSGTELFLGARYEPGFGHVILCGPGGIFVEALGDTASGLAPLTSREAISMIRSLRSYRMIKGMRGRPGINESVFGEIIVRFSGLLNYAPEIREVDLNPLIGNIDKITVADSRIRIEK